VILFGEFAMKRYSKPEKKVK
jgi:hypothetical protein